MPEIMVKCLSYLDGAGKYPADLAPILNAARGVVDLIRMRQCCEHLQRAVYELQGLEAKGPVAIGFDLNRINHGLELSSTAF